MHILLDEEKSNPDESTHYAITRCLCRITDELCSYLIIVDKKDDKMVELFALLRDSLYTAAYKDFIK